MHAWREFELSIHERSHASQQRYDLAHTLFDAVSVAGDPVLTMLLKGKAIDANPDRVFGQLDFWFCWRRAGDNDGLATVASSQLLA